MAFGSHGKTQSQFLKRVVGLNDQYSPIEASQNKKKRKKTSNKASSSSTNINQVLNSWSKLSEENEEILIQKLCENNTNDETKVTELVDEGLERLILPDLRISVQKRDEQGDPEGSLALVGKRIELAEVVSSLVKEGKYDRKVLTLNDIAENESGYQKLPNLLLKAFGDFSFEKMFLHTGLKCLSGKGLQGRKLSEINCFQVGGGIYPDIPYVNSYDISAAVMPSLIQTLQASLLLVPNPNEIPYDAQMLYYIVCDIIFIELVYKGGITTKGQDGKKIVSEINASRANQQVKVSEVKTANDLDKPICCGTVFELYFYNKFFELYPDVRGDVDHVTVSSNIFEHFISNNHADFKRVLRGETETDLQNKRISLSVLHACSLFKARIRNYVCGIDGNKHYVKGRHEVDENGTETVEYEHFRQVAQKFFPHEIHREYFHIAYQLIMGEENQRKAVKVINTVTSGKNMEIDAFEQKEQTKPPVQLKTYHETYHNGNGLGGLSILIADSMMHDWEPQIASKIWEELRKRDPFLYDCATAHFSYFLNTPGNQLHKLIHDGSRNGVLNEDFMLSLHGLKGNFESPFRKFTDGMGRGEYILPIMLTCSHQPDSGPRGYMITKSSSDSDFYGLVHQLETLQTWYGPYMQFYAKDSEKRTSSAIMKTTRRAIMKRKRSPYNGDIQSGTSVVVSFANPDGGTARRDAFASQNIVLYDYTDQEIDVVFTLPQRPQIDKQSLETLSDIPQILRELVYIKYDDGKTVEKRETLLPDFQTYYVLIVGLYKGNPEFRLPTFAKYFMSDQRFFIEYILANVVFKRDDAVGTAAEKELIHQLIQEDIIYPEENENQPWTFKQKVYAKYEFDLYKVLDTGDKYEYYKDNADENADGQSSPIQDFDTKYEFFITEAEKNNMLQLTSTPTFYKGYGYSRANPAKVLASYLHDVKTCLGNDEDRYAVYLKFLIEHYIFLDKIKSEWLESKTTTQSGKLNGRRRSQRISGNRGGGKRKERVTRKSRKSNVKIRKTHKSRKSKFKSRKTYKSRKKK